MSTLATTNLKNASSGSNNIVLNTDGTTTIAAPSNIIKSGTAVASTSGVAIDFTGIPSWVKRVTVMLQGVSTNGTSLPLVQLGDAGGIETTGYISTSNQLAAGNNVDNSTAGFVVRSATATNVLSGSVIIQNINGNEWVSHHVLKQSTGGVIVGGGDKTLSDTLTQLRITTVNGTDTFDAGSINILYEG